MKYSTILLLRLLSAMLAVDYMFASGNKFFGLWFMFANCVNIWFDMRKLEKKIIKLERSDIIYESE